MDIKTVLINLTILGQITTGTKLNTREKYFTLDINNWSQGLKRLYRRDDRNVTYEKISLLIKQVEELVKMSDKNNIGYTEEEFYQELVPIITSTVTGLEYLKNTYDDDRTFVAQIDYEVNILNRILNKISDKEKED
jgi:hypothetical protein